MPGHLEKPGRHRPFGSPKTETEPLTLAQHIRLASPCLCPATVAGDASGCDGDGTWRTWATPFGQAGTNQGDGNARAFAYQSTGFAAGGDRRVGDEGNGLLGFATGYSN